MKTRSDTTKKILSIRKPIRFIDLDIIDKLLSSVRFNGNIKKIRIFNITDIELTGGKKELNDRTINGEIDITMPMYTKQKWTLKIKRDKYIEKDLDIKYGVELREQLLSLITQMERDSKLDDLGI